jgi:hypothetical protein
MQMASSKKENLAQVLSCKLKFVHAQAEGQKLSVLKEQQILFY